MSSAAEAVGEKRKYTLVRRRATNGEVVAELKYLMERTRDVQAEMNKSFEAMVELLTSTSPHSRSSLNAGIGILEEYIASTVQCGEDADELFNKRQEELQIKASRPRVRNDASES